MILWRLNHKYSMYILDVIWTDVNPILDCSVRRCVTLLEYHKSKGDEIYSALYLATLEMLNFLETR